MHGFELDRGELAEAALMTPAVYVASIQVTIARRSSSLVLQRWVLGTFFCSRAKKDSIAALSAHAPTPAHRSGQSVVAKQAHELGRAKLTRFKGSKQHRLVGPRVDVHRGLRPCSQSAGRWTINPPDSHSGWTPKRGRATHVTNDELQKIRDAMAAVPNDC